MITKTFPLSTVRAVLAASGKTSLRERDLPAHVVVYYVIALALYMQASYREVLRCLLEGLQWLRDPATPLKVAGKSGISQARARLGWEAVRQLHDAVVRPIALPATLGAWYRQWRLVSLDGSTLDVAPCPRSTWPRQFRYLNNRTTDKQPRRQRLPQTLWHWSRTARMCVASQRAAHDGRDHTGAARLAAQRDSWPG